MFIWMQKSSSMVSSEINHGVAQFRVRSLAPPQLFNKAKMWFLAKKNSKWGLPSLPSLPTMWFFKQIIWVFTALIVLFICLRSSGDCWEFHIIYIGSSLSSMSVPVSFLGTLGLECLKSCLNEIWKLCLKSGHTKMLKVKGKS